MEKMLFELTNEQRKYLGLIPVEKNWDLVKLGDMYLYFDEDIIRKKIISDENNYLESELFEKTTENRTILLPKTAKGKARKLNFTATQSFGSVGVYFGFSLNYKYNYITIANYTTQTTYFSESLGENKTMEDIKAWLGQWIAETTPRDLEEIEAFKIAGRQHCKFKEGDFFTFKIGRRNWGFGRIILDVAKLRKEKDFKKYKNYGLAHLMGKALVVKVYHKISDTPDINLEELANCMALPSQAIMDNHFYYGEKKIIGNSALKTEDYDMLISYSRSITGGDKNTVYLQYGTIYKETDISKFDKYLWAEEKYANGDYKENPYRYESIGYGLNDEELEQCIAEKSNDAYWNKISHEVKYDLRNPENIAIKRAIFNYFDLDADKNYTDNLNLYLEKNI